MRFLSILLTVSLVFSYPVSASDNATIKAAPHPSPLPRGSDIGKVEFDCGGNGVSRRCSLADFMKDARVCALLVIKSGVVRLERFAKDPSLCNDDNEATNRNDGRKLYSVASVTKSITSTLLGMAIAEKFGARTKEEIAAVLKKPVGYYIPSLAQSPKSAYADVPLDDLLRMRSGVRWSEWGWHGFFSDNARFLKNVREKSRYTVVEFAKSYRTRVHGKPLPFNYSALDAATAAAVTDAILRDERLTHFATNRLWASIGAESDAKWGVDKTGLAMGNCCFKATVGDLGRFGMLVLNNGRTPTGKQLIPAAWLGLATQRQKGSDHVIPNDSPSQNVHCPMDYRYFWWLRQKRLDFTAVGVAGQFIHVYPKDDVVIVQISDWHDWNDGDRRECESFDAHDALVRAVH